MKKYHFLLLLALICSQISFSQEEQSSLLGLLGEESKSEPVTNAFKSHRVINSQSMEMLGEGALDFRILHRFGNLNQGYQQLFGLDQASMRIGFDYGVLKNFMIGVGRSTLNKEIDGYAKYRIFWQSEGGKENMPISLIWVSGFTANGEQHPFQGTGFEDSFTHRLAYFHQLIIGRKFSNKLTLQITPTLLHQNVVINSLTPNDLFAIGIGGRYKVSQRVAFVWDYSFLFNRFPDATFAYPLSLGFDIDTGGHVFQLHISNAAGMNERAFLTAQNGSWLKGDVKIGFNLSRVFQLKKNTL